jgi:hypothetical protein
MIRQRALAWATVLALVATVVVAPLSPRYSPSVAALAQDDSTADAGEPTDLAIVALHCAEAPAAEALTSYFTSATPPTMCAPAVGVGIAVSENGDPVPGGPFTTDVDGTLIIPVGLGSAIEVREDPKTLPAGYAPLTQEANGVPYANPVQLDSAVAGAAVLFVNVPSTVTAELAQGTAADDASEPTDLAVVALNCADAPATEALTSFFGSGTPPSGCSPAPGVTVAVTENEKPLSGSPFRTDTAGTLAVRIGLGSEVTVKEDTTSLPSGFEPLTQEANGVPYANPVRFDSAVAGAAVLFVNVPTSVAARLNQGTPAVDAGEATDLAHAVRLDRTGCDPAYPDERTCIAPGRPLAEPCSIIDQRNFTVLAPDPRGLDSDGDGIGCEPISSSGGTILRGASFNLYTSGVDVGRAAPARTGDVAVADNPVRSGDGVWVSPPESNRADGWFVRRDRNRAGLWFVDSNRNSTGNIAVVSNPVFVGRGLWTWPNRHGKDDWFWQSRNHDGIWFWQNRISVGNITVAGSGNGNVAIASNPVFIGNGLSRWSDHTHDDGRFWPGRDRNEDWFWSNRFGNGIWGWPNRIAIGNLAVARSGNGNLAVVSNPVFISNGLRHSPSVRNRSDDWFVHNNGLWTWPNRPGNDAWRWRDRLGKGIWGWPSTISVGNLTFAGSGNGSGNVAVVSNPVFISNGLWRWPGHIRDNDWFWQNRNRDGTSFQPNIVSVGNLTIAGSGNGNVAIASNPVFISHGVWAWPNQHDKNDWFWQSRNHDGRFWPGHNRFGNGIWGWPSIISVGNLTIAGSGNGNVAIASNPVFISSGVWHWPGHINNRFWLWPNRGNNGQWRRQNHFGNGVWGWPSNIFVGNLTIARSGKGNIAIVSNPVFISSGVWFVAPDRNHDDHWLVHRDRDRADDQLRRDEVAQADRSDVEPMTLNGGGTNEAPPSKIEQLGTSEQPTLTVNGGLAVEPLPADSTQPPSDSSIQPPADSVQALSDGTEALPSDSYVESPSDGSVETPSDGSVAPAPDASVQPSTDAGAPDSGYVAPDASYVDASNVDSGYVAPDPGIDPGYSAPDPGYVDPSYVAPEPNYVDPGVDPGYVAPEPSYVEPNYVEPSYVDPGYVDPGYVAPEPNIEPSYSAPQPSYVDPGIDASYAAPEPNYSAPEPNYGDVGNGSPNPGMNAENTGLDPSNLAQESNFVEPSFVDAGNGNSGNGDAGNIAADPSMDAAGNVDAGNDAPNSDAGHGKRKRGGHND